MTTLALYVAFLVSQDRYAEPYLSDVLADFAKIEAFLAYAKIGPYVISQAAQDEVRAGKKIAAIKIVRAEYPLVDGRAVGLKEAKEIVEAYGDTLAIPPWPVYN